MSRSIIPIGVARQSSAKSARHALHAIDPPFERLDGKIAFEGYGCWPDALLGCPTWVPTWPVAMRRHVMIQPFPLVEVRICGFQHDGDIDGHDKCRQFFHTSRRVDSLARANHSTMKSRPDAELWHLDATVRLFLRSRKPVVWMCYQEKTRRLSNTHAIMSTIKAMPIIFFMTRDPHLTSRT